MPRSRVRLLFAAVLFVAALSAAAFTACIPGYSFGESAGTDGGSDATASSNDAPSLGEGSTPDSFVAPDAATDAPADAPLPPFDGGFTTIAIADAGSKIGSTGYGYQVHAIFAQHDQRYWLFYVDDTAGHIESRASSDFVTWTPGAPIALGGDFTLADGNNFSVAYADVGGADVVHLTIDAQSGSLGYAAFHVRATIAGGVLTASAPVALPKATNGGTCPNDAPATTIARDGRVYDVNAWTDHGSTESTTCDTNVYRSPAAEVGAAWDAGAFAYDGYYVSLPSFAYSHDLVSLTDAGGVLLLYPDEDNQALTSFDSIGWDVTFDGGGAPGTGGGTRESPGSELFAGTSSHASSNDWSACALAANDVHVVRHVLTSAGNSVSAFQEVVYDGSSWQTTASPPPASTSLSNTGVVLLGDGTPSDGLLLVTAGPDDALNVAKWTAASGWTSVAKIPGTNPRQSLSGTGCAATRATVLWTETIGPANVIESADLSGLLRP